MVEKEKANTTELKAKKTFEIADIDNLDCLLYTSDAADDMQCVDLGGRRIIKNARFISVSYTHLRAHET